MMKRYFLMFISFYACFILNAQIVNIPDANFKNVLVNDVLINANQDTEIQIAEADTFSGTIYASNKNIYDLTGIEYFKSLDRLRCDDNHLTSINIDSNTVLTYLDCSNNNLTTIEISNDTALTFLNCYNNNLDSLNISNNFNLESLFCSDNNLTNLDLSNNIDLLYLGCGLNEITHLNLSNNHSLISLGCNDLDSNYEFDTLDLSNNINLVELDCYSNELTSLDLSNNILLENLNCYGNYLTELDLSNNPKLERLKCEGNFITSLDLSNSPMLNFIHCYGNLLTSLNVKNGNNTAIDNYSFNAGNPYLYCIEVDDSSWSAANWTNIHSQSYFSNNCNAMTAPPISDFVSYYVDVCLGETTHFIDVSGYSPTSWLWDFGDGNTSTQQNPSHTYLSPGIFDVSLTVTNSSGTDTEIKPGFVEVIEFDTSITVYNGALYVSAGGNVDYQWVDCNNAYAPINGETNHSFTPTVSGNYAVIVSNWQCADTSSCINFNPVEISENSLEDPISIYPNPTNNYICINVNNLKNTKVFDIHGRMIYEGTNREIDLSMQSKGIYIIKVITNKKIVIQKVIKQ